VGHLFLSRCAPFARPPEAGWVLDARDKQNAVQMIDLVLQHASQQASPSRLTGRPRRLSPFTSTH
jgi:hypothetical protein